MLNTCTGITSQLLTDQYHTSLPTAQSFLNYVLLCLVFTTWLVCRRGCAETCRMLRCRGWKYACLALIDVEANYLLVKAYKYTTLTSITLLDCFSIPTVLALSWILLKVRYKLLHIVGVTVCLLGVGCLVWADIGDTSLSGNGRDRLLGDMLCLSGATLYGFSNVGEEFAVKNYDLVEFLGMIGLFGSIVNGIQLGLLEWEEVLLVPWTEWRILCLIVAFAVCQFGFYVLTPFVIQITSAVTVNLSLLTSDFFALIAGILIFKYNFHALYFVSFFMIVCGIIIYSSKPTPLHVIGQSYSDMIVESGDLTDGQGHTAVTSVTDVTRSVSQTSTASTYGTVERSQHLPRSQSIPARAFAQSSGQPIAVTTNTLGRPATRRPSSGGQRPYRTLERSHSGARVHWAGSPDPRGSLRFSTFRVNTSGSPPPPLSSTSSSRPQPEGILKSSLRRSSTPLYHSSNFSIRGGGLEDVQC